MIHIHSIEYAPRPSRIEIKPDPKKAREVRDDLERELVFKRRPKPWWNEKD